MIKIKASNNDKILNKKFVITAAVFVCLVGVSLSTAKYASAEVTAKSIVNKIVTKTSDAASSAAASGPALTNEAKEAIKKTAAAARDKLKTTVAKLSEEKLKKCELRESVIGNIISRISDRGSKQLEVFDKIFDKTKAFYVDKKLNVSNYEDLVADANAKKADAVAALGNIKAVNTAGFRCSDNAPKELISVFKDDVQVKNNAIKDYKIAINNLLVAVKSAAELNKTNTTTDVSGGQQ